MRYDELGTQLTSLVTITFLNGQKIILVGVTLHLLNFDRDFIRHQKLKGVGASRSGQS